MSILITLIYPIPPEPLISHQSLLTFLPLSLCDLMSLIRAVVYAWVRIYLLEHGPLALTTALKNCPLQKKLL